jgi:hypothetical protein
VGSAAQVRDRSGSPNRAARVRSGRAAGLGPVSYTAWPWNRRTVARTWARSACSSSTPGRWPPRLLRPMPQCKRRKPPTAQSTASVSKLGGLRVSLMPRRLWRRTKGGGRGGGGASPGPGVPMPCTIGWKRSRNGRNARSEGASPSLHCPRPPAALVSGARQQPTCRLPTRRAGQAWRPPWGQRAVQSLRYSRPIRRHIAPWHQGGAGARIPPPSARGGGRNPHGWRPEPGARWWACSCMRSSHGRSAALFVSRPSTSPATRGRRPSPRQPLSLPSFHQ